MADKPSSLRAVDTFLEREFPEWRELQGAQTGRRVTWGGRKLRVIDVSPTGRLVLGSRWFWWFPFSYVYMLIDPAEVIWNG